MVARKAKKRNDLKRKAAKRKDYDRVLIVCEGEKTELVYFEDLINHYRLSTANIVVTPANGSDPVSVVDYAKTLQKEEKKQGEKFDKIYCVFDRDEHTCFDAAYNKLSRNNFQAARSWPCFEYWLLLHFGYQRKPFSPTQGKTAAQNCGSALKAELPTYSKGMKGIFAQLLPSIDKAKKNAIKALRDADKTSNSNPSTEVHRLVEYLQDLNIRKD